MPEQEEWRPVPGFDGYEVSNLGRVLSHRRRSPALLRPCHDTKGYLHVRLMRDGRPFTRRVHLLVTAAFIGPRPEGLEVRHLDGDKENCQSSNLAYGSRSENTFDQIRHGTHVHASKSRCVNDHEFTERNTRVAQGRRWCRACAAIRSTAYRQRRALRAASVPTASAA